MVLSTEWSQVEVIDLVNDGSGLGFGIVGGRSTGVVIKSILPGGIADRDGRLQSGDHILQINDVQTRGLASEHVATILRQCSTLEPVRMVVARSVDSTQCTALGSDAPIVPTKTLTDPDELETLLLQNGGYPTDIISQSQSDGDGDGDGDGDIEASSAAAAVSLRSEQHQTKIIDASYHPPIVLTNNNYNLEQYKNQNQNQEDDEEVNDSVSRLLSSDNNSCCSSDSPESQTIHVHLEKNSYGLGITVAGYVWEREDLSGIFVKGISEGSAAHLTGQIHLNDRIVEVDGRSLRGVTNHEAVEMLRQTNVTVDLVLERYLRGPRYEHLLNALQADAPSGLSGPNAPGSTNNHISPPSPSVTTLSWFPADDNDTTDNIIIEPEPESHTTIDSLTMMDAFIDHDRDPDTVEVFVDPHFESGSITPDLDMVVQKRWSSLLDDENIEIVVAQLRKLRGLGISLEGTVEVEDGIELRPRHFIRSILPEGPVGRNGKLNTGDELLEVNGQKLLGRNHVDVVKILKELPETVRIVCARQSEGRGGGGGGGGMYNRCRIINTAQDREGFAARNLLSGSLRTLLNHDDDVPDVVPDVPPPPPPPPAAAAPSVPTDGIDEDHEQQESLNNTSSTATLADVSAVVDDVDVDVDVDVELESTNGTGYDDDLNNDSNVLIHVNDNDNDVIDLNQHEQHESIIKNELNDLIESKCNSSLIESTKLNLNLDLNNIYQNDQNDDKILNNKNEIETINEEIKELINNEEEEEEEEAIKNQTNGLEHEEHEHEHEHEQEHCSPPKLTKMMIEQVTAPSVSVDDDDNDNDNDSIVTYLAIWKQEIEWIELLKINNTKGLGFSILDYQDPLDPYGTVIVVRSLIPGGCASLNGRLHPGDRLMYVNDISFKNVTLQYAVQILKSIQPGHTVRIGFSKPMPLLKQHQHQHHKTTITTSAASTTATATATSTSTSLSIQDNYFIW